MSLLRIIALNVLIIYPFLELTRLIYWYSKTYFLVYDFVLELIVFWTCWTIFNILLKDNLPEKV